MKYKSIFFLAFILGFSLQNFGQSLDETSSKISEVTVFLNGAQVTRTANINLKKGENIFRLTGLTQSLIQGSVQVMGNPDYIILSVKNQYNYSKSGQSNPMIKLKTDSLTDMQFTLGMRNSLERVYLEEKQLLYANKGIKGNDAVLLVDDLEEMADFFRTRLLEIEYKLLEINDEKQKINKTIQRLNNEIYQLGAKANLTTSEIYVTIEGKKAGPSKLDFSFQVSAASWYPTYDLRTEDTDEDIELRYKAKVFQNTGNDWKNVDLTLSSGNPNLGGIAPDLNPWYLYLYDINAYKNSNDKRAKQNAYYQPAMELSAEDDAMGGSGVYENVQAVNNIINTEFKINTPYDIPSGNVEYDVEIQRSNIPATYEYLCVPKLDRDAFLIANIVDWRNYNLLPGETQIYFKGTFVGSSYLDPASTDDTLQLSLGRDPSLVVQRESIKEFCKTQTLGLKKKTTKAYKITVKNNKNINVDLRIEDQIPLSNNSDIEVNVEETSGASYDEESGKLSWDLKLAPGESKELILRFNVKYPKGKNISNL